MSEGEAHDTAPAPHLDWASRIKAQHYHLQQQLTAHPVASELPSCASTPSDPVDGDLARWQAALAAPEEAQRLQAYATAMHHLATKYWEAPMHAEHGREEAVEKRAREEAADTTVELSTGPPQQTGDVQESGAEISAEALQRRLYNDRVRCSLNCLETYLLGRPRDVGATNPSVHSTKVSDAANEKEADGKQELAQCSPIYDVVPLILSRALKPLRRRFFEEHGRMVTVQECNDIMADLARASETRRRQRCASDGATSGSEGHASGEPTTESVWEVAMMYTAHVIASQQEGKPSTASSLHHVAAPANAAAAELPVLRVLDVGSCYGPFFNQTLSAPVIGHVPLAVTAMDLCPYEGDEAGERQEAQTTKRPRTDTSAYAKEYDNVNEFRSTNCRVLKGDWLSIRFLPHTSSVPDELPEGQRTTARGRVRLSLPSCKASGAGEGAGVSLLQLPSVLSLVADSYDAVIFCLLLSYMPTARLRYRACLHAYLALKPGGLLVIISTRTQGSRRSRWEEQWANTLATIGFTPVHKQSQKKIVVLSFEKAMCATNKSEEGDSSGAATAEEGNKTEADIQAWIASKMALPEAANGLPIVADTQLQL